MEMGIKFFLKLFFLSILMFSCSKREKKYFDNGNLKAEYQVNDEGVLEGEFISYYKNGHMKSIDLYRNNIKVDSTIVYDSLEPNKKKLVIFHNKLSLDSIYSKNYEDGEVTSEGFVYKSQKTGKWKYYKNKRLEKVLQYKNINGTQYLNQGWFFDNNGDSIKAYGNNYKFEYTINKKDSQNEIDISITYNPLIAKNANVILLYNEKLNKQFSNFHKIDLDTILFVNNRTEIKYILDNKEVDNFNFRAVIKEYADLVPKDSITYKERFVYLDEKIR